MEAFEILVKAGSPDFEKCLSTYFSSDPLSGVLPGSPADMFYPWHLWPKPRQQQMINQHTEGSNARRYDLFVFFVYNGLSPNLAAEWNRIVGFVRRKNILTPRILLDDKAVRQSTQLIKQWDTQTLVGPHATYYNIESKTVRNCLSDDIRDPKKRALDDLLTSSINMDDVLN